MQRLSAINKAPRISSFSTATSKETSVVSKAQFFVLGSGCGFLSWLLVVQGFLLFSSLRYKGNYVDETRARYVIAATKRVSHYAEQVLATAHNARVAVDYAVQRKLYFEPLDYQSFQLALEPVFEAKPSLRVVDVGFDSRNISITMRRQIGIDASRPFVVQSDADDCYDKLGQWGCLSALPASSQHWFRLGLELPAGQEADNSSSVTIVGTPYQWYPVPGFVPASSGAIHYGSTGFGLNWAPAYVLVFRSLFPGSGGNLSVIGRVIVEVSGLETHQLLDDINNLGPDGAVYICDKHGSVLASLSPAQKVFIQSPSGIVRYQYAWELPTSWAGKLSPDDFQGSGRSFKTDDDVQIKIAAIPGTGMDHFYVIVAAERGRFVNPNMKLLGDIGQALVIIPYVGSFLIGIVTYVMLAVEKRRELRRVHAETEDKPGSLAAIANLPPGLTNRSRVGGRMSQLAIKT